VSQGRHPGTNLKIHRNLEEKRGQPTGMWKWPPLDWGADTGIASRGEAKTWSRFGGGGQGKDQQSERKDNGNKVWYDRKPPCPHAKQGWGGGVQKPREEAGEPLTSGRTHRGEETTGLTRGLGEAKTKWGGLRKIGVVEKKGRKKDQGTEPWT